MPTYSFIGPDNKEYEVETDAPATEEQVAAEFFKQSQSSTQAPSQPQAAYSPPKGAGGLDMNVSPEDLAKVDEQGKVQLRTLQNFGLSALPDVPVVAGEMAAGAAVGSAIFPGVGTVVGSIVAPWAFNAAAGRQHEEAKQQVFEGVVGKEKMDAIQETMAQDQQQAPNMAVIGTAAPSLLLGRPGRAPDLINRAIGASFGGGQEFLQELGQPDGPQAKTILTAAAIGALNNKPTALGKALYSEQLFRKPIEPEAKAKLNVLGEQIQTNFVDNTKPLETYFNSIGVGGENPKLGNSLVNNFKNSIQSIKHSEMVVDDIARKTVVGLQEEAKGIIPPKQVLADFQPAPQAASKAGTPQAPTKAVQEEGATLAPPRMSDSDKLTYLMSKSAELAQAEHALDFNPQKAKEAYAAKIKFYEDALRVGSIDGAPIDPKQRNYMEGRVSRLKQETPNFKDTGKNYAGMTTVEAQEKIDAIKSDPNYQKIRKASDALIEMNNAELERSLANGEITQELYDHLKSVYPKYIPLERVMPEDELPDFGQGPVRTSNSSVTTVTKAYGSDRDVQDPWEISLSRIAQGRKASILNQHRRGLATTIEANQNNFGEDFQVWRPIKDKTTGKYSTTQYERPAKITTFGGKIKTPTTNIVSLKEGGTIIPFKEEGRTQYIQVKNPEMYKILIGKDRPEVPKLIQVIGHVTNIAKSLATTASPNFWIKNAMRDPQSAVVNVMNLTDSIADTSSMAKYYPEAYGAYLDYVGGKKSNGAATIKEMMEGGMFFGRAGNYSRENITSTVKDLKAYASNKSYQVLRGVLHGIENVQAAVEYAPRYAAFKTARASGMSISDAVTVARKATVDFGSSGRYSPIIQDLYAFYNPSIQGNRQFLQSMRNPKTAAMVVAGTLASQLAVHVWNKMQDPDYNQKLYPWDIVNSVNLVLPSRDDGIFRYIPIPTSPELRPLLPIVRNIARAMGGEKIDSGKVLQEFSAAVVNNFNPVGGSTFAEAVTPTIADIPMSILRNRRWSGGKVHPEEDSFLAKSGLRAKDVPMYARYFPGLEKDILGRWSIQAAKDASVVGIKISPNDIKYAVENGAGGLGTFITQVAASSEKLSKATPLAARDIPMFSSVFRERDEDLIPIVREIDERTKKSLDTQIENHNLKKLSEARETYAMFQEIKRLPTPDQKDYIKTLSYDDPQQAHRLLAQVISYKEHSHQLAETLNRFPVESGERAGVIVDTLNALDEDAREDFNNQLTTEGITKDPTIRRQVRQLLNGQEIKQPKPQMDYRALKKADK